MKHLGTLLSLLCAQTILAQCAHDPVIAPNALQLCPYDTAMLNTQPADAYQWYRNGDPIPGATAQSLQVIGSLDAGSTFKVLVTLDSCAESSPDLYIGGIALPQPQVFWSGNALFNDTAGIHFCAGSDVLLLLQPPYDSNITWYLNGAAIAGATDDTLFVTATGDYTVSASNSGCPDAIATLLDSTAIVLEPIQQATIVWDDTLLCAEPPGLDYTWYINGIPVANDFDQCIPADFIGGTYTVLVDYGAPCEAVSAPLLVSGIGEQKPLSPGVLWPNPASGIVNVAVGYGSIGTWYLHDMMGRLLSNGSASTASMSLSVEAFAPGSYVLSMEGRPSSVLMVR